MTSEEANACVQWLAEQGEPFATMAAAMGWALDGLTRAGVDVATDPATVTWEPHARWLADLALGASIASELGWRRP